MPASLAGAPDRFRRKIQFTSPYQIPKKIPSPEAHPEREYIYIFYLFTAPQHFLYFLPLPQGQGSFGPIFAPLRTVRPYSLPSDAPLVEVISATFVRLVSSSFLGMMVIIRRTVSSRIDMVISSKIS